MTLNSKQAEAINTRLGDSHLSLDPRPAKIPRKAQKELTEEEQKNKEIKTNLRKALQKCDKAMHGSEQSFLVLFGLCFVPCSGAVCFQTFGGGFCLVALF